MGRPKQPIELVIRNGRKNLTKAEIAERRATEIQPVAENIIAPSNLSKKQKDEFYKIAEQLKRLKIVGETDIDAIARYILSRDLYNRLTKQMMKPAVMNDPYTLEKYMKNQDKAFKQCRASANDLGLTISSRCKLVAPKVEEKEEKRNKFNKFEKRITG